MNNDSPQAHRQTPTHPGTPTARTRTRTGCLNCRRKKRKCDEQRPACATCERRCERCEWGLKISFRSENAQALEEAHPSMTRMARKRPRKFQILNVTSEVIRDYDDSSLSVDSGYPNAQVDEIEADAHPAPDQSTPDGRNLDAAADSLPLHGSIFTHGSDFLNVPVSSILPEQFSPSSTRHTESAVANLLHLRQGDRFSSASDGPLPEALGSMPMEMMTDYLGSMQGLTPDGSLDDGVFLPGSAYHELHSTLRNHLIQEVKSNAPTRLPSPTGSLPNAGSSREESEQVTPESLEPPATVVEPPFLSKEEEIILWRNWFQEIAPWLDKFDNECHFQHIIPTMAAQHEHLKYSMLALSARQIEQKDTNEPTGRSLALYQQAIHQLLPELPTRSTAVIASCVILCVLEMLSCSPKAWRRHLDGCASLMQAVGINGFVGGVEEALFWCFARMDVCGGLISSVKTLIPSSRWAHGPDLDADVAAFCARSGFDTWANYIVYLMARVLDLLAAEPTTPLEVPSRGDPSFRTNWLRLWKHIAEWHDLRPAVLHPIMTIPSSEKSPFPTVLFSNPAGISGNQLYHTASMLMLQNQPPKLRVIPKPRSILWHARQICAISMSNDHHGAWTNSVQPLWIAGKCMSHPAEHRAILELLRKIEKVSGWKTKWRADDLKEFWGDLGE